MLSQLEESMPADKARAVAMQQNWPNGAMLFDSNGVLLQANDRAARELRESGARYGHESLHGHDSRDSPAVKPFAECRRACWP